MREHLRELALLGEAPSCCAVLLIPNLVKVHPLPPKQARIYKAPGTCVTRASWRLIHSVFNRGGGKVQRFDCGRVSLSLHTVSGYMLTPWLTSRPGRMSAVVVFVGVLAGGWLWGLRGLLLGAPILMAVKAVYGRVEDLKPIGELLGS